MESLKTTISNAILNQNKSNTTQLENMEQNEKDHTITWSCTTQAKKASLIIGNMAKWIYKSPEAAKQSDTSLNT